MFGTFQYFAFELEYEMPFPAYGAVYSGNVRYIWWVEDSGCMNGHAIFVN